MFEEVVSNQVKLTGYGKLLFGAVVDAMVKRVIFECTDSSVLISEVPKIVMFSVTSVIDMANTDYHEFYIEFLTATQRALCKSPIFNTIMRDKLWIITAGEHDLLFESCFNGDLDYNKFAKLTNALIAEGRFWQVDRFNLEQIEIVHRISANYRRWKL